MSTAPSIRKENPNNVTASLDDARSAIGVCPLMNNQLQLLPVRYGLVERLDPRDSLTMPYALKSRPLGIRLLRDGWLYVIVEKSPEAELHEYRIENGVVTQRLWQGGAVHSDQREASVGEPALVYSRQARISVAYAEVQWSAGKCAQVVADRAEREHFMHAVGLHSVDPQKGAMDLLTPRQAEQWIAEIAEAPSSIPVPEGGKPDEVADYRWESTPVFRHTQLGELQCQVKTAYADDHVYLVVPDDLGVLRDLAEHQDLVTGWISDWSRSEADQHKYVMGCYIETLYTATSANIERAAEGDPQYARLHEETNEEQRQLIIDYVNVKHQTQWNGAGTHRGAIAAAQARMRQSLGTRYSRYEELIETIDDSTKAALHGEKWKLGQEGIHDLIDRPAMEAFVARQRAHLQRWNRRLERITADRIKLVIEQRFHRSAWYFDSAIQAQLEAALATEYACTKDICRTDEAAEAIAQLLDNQPGLSLPGFFTLSLANQTANAAKLLTLTKYARDSLLSRSDYEGAQSLTGYFSRQLSGNLAANLHLSESGATLDRLRNTAYEPAKQLRMASALDETLQSLRSGQAIAPEKLLRAIPDSAWLDVLRTFDSQGITLNVASPSQVAQFRFDMDQVLQLRQQLTSLKHQIKYILAMERHGRAHKGSHQKLVKERKALQQRIEPWEKRIAHAMSPLGEEGGKVSFKIAGLQPNQVAEFQRMADDFRLKKPFKGLANNVFRSAGGDVFASALAVLQVVIAREAFNEIGKRETQKVEDQLVLTNAIFSASGSVLMAAQGIAITSLSVAIKNYASVAGQVKWASHLGRITGVLSPFAYISGITAAVTNILGNKGSASKWFEALRAGEQGLFTGASLTLAGDAGQLGLNGWALRRSSVYIFEALTSAAEFRTFTWVITGARLVNIFARVNLIGLGITGLQLAGEWIYNRHNKSELDTFLLKGVWGRESARRSLAEDRAILMDMSARPKFSLSMVNNTPMAVLSLPGLCASELDEVGIGLSAYWLKDHRFNDWEHWTDALAYQFTLLSAPDAPLALGFEIYPHESNAEHGLAIKLRYPLMLNELIYRERLFETITLNVQGGKIIPEITLLRTRTMDAPWTVLTTDVLVPLPVVRSEVQ